MIKKEKIKTYESFLNLFKKSDKKSIEDYEDEIDSFLYDLKDISIGYHW